MGDELSEQKQPISGNDCFALPRGVDWTPFDEILDSLRSCLSPINQFETQKLDQSVGRVVAKPIIANRSHPPHANSAVDGYGIHGPIGEGEHSVPVIATRIAAGEHYKGSVPSGYAVRILTGAALPNGVNTVILDENIQKDGTSISFRGPIKRGMNTRKAGEDTIEGNMAIEAGRCLTAADLALMSSIGVSEVCLLKPLRVAILSTGSELVQVGSTAKSHQVYDANRPMLLAMVTQFGFQPMDCGCIPDNRSELRDVLNSASKQAHLILTTGGASGGDEDHVSAILKEHGVLKEWRIAVKPGRPLAFGTWNGTPLFGLPGNPVAAMVCTLIFALPAMKFISGQGWNTPQGFQVPAAFHKSKKAERREFLRARMRHGRAEVFKSEGSGRISGLSWAEGLVELGDPAQDIHPGDLVRYIPLSSFGL